MAKSQKTGKKIDLNELASRSKQAAFKLSSTGQTQKNAALGAMAELLRKKSDEILAENSKDVADARAKKRPSALVDRLTLSEKRIEDMASGLEEVAGLPDPVGEVTGMWRRPNGLWVGQMRIPLGVILLIYEARPNVTADAAGLCIKSGNAIILRGGSESLRSNMAVGKVLMQGLKKAGLPEDAIQVVPTADRKAIDNLLQMEETIDLVIPRGGEELIRKVVDISRIPVLKHYKGVCHVFVDSKAQLKMAQDICYNAKVQRPGVCNAMETMLVHKGIAKKFLPKMAERFKKAGVELRGCSETRKIIKGIKAATKKDWYEEYLDLILAVRVVESLDEAIAHIRQYGSDHTESVVSSDHTRAMRFLTEVGSSSVMINASTRFSDGGEYGLGAEIGISTSRLHAFGPMGLESLTSRKYIVFGEGHTRW